MRGLVEVWDDRVDGENYQQENSNRNQDEITFVQSSIGFVIKRDFLDNWISCRAADFHFFNHFQNFRAISDRITNARIVNHVQISQLVQAIESFRVNEGNFISIQADGLKIRIELEQIFLQTFNRVEVKSRNFKLWKFSQVTLMNFLQTRSSEIYQQKIWKKFVETLREKIDFRLIYDSNCFNVWVVLWWPVSSWIKRQLYSRVVLDDRWKSRLASVKFLVG